MTIQEHQDSQETPADAARATVVKWLLWLAVIVLTPVILAALLAAIFAWRWWQEQRVAAAAVAQEVARLQATGQPMTPQDLYTFHRVPDGISDTTSAWLAAQKSFDGPRFNADAKLLPFVGEGNKDLLRPDAVGTQFAAAEQFLQTYEAMLQLTLAAAREPGECRFPVKFEQGIGAALQSDVQNVRTLVRLLALSVRVRAFSGDAEGAAQSLAAMFAASDTLGHQLTIVEQQIRLATLGAAFQEAEFLLNEVELTDEQLARLSQRIAASDVQSSLAQGLMGERAMGFQSFQQLPALSPRSVDCQKYLELMSLAIAASHRPIPAGREQMQTIAAQFAAQQAALPPWERQKYVLTAQIVPVITKAFDAAARALAYRDALIASIAAERYRLKNGQFPAQLADLSPEFLPSLPIDPFDGQPLRLVHRDGEFVIYSIGQDGKDDGASNLPGNPGEPDIVVRVRAEKGASP